MKRCSVCQNEFPATPEYFNRDRGNKDGLRPQCKECFNKKQQAWRSANVERYAEYQRTAYMRDPDGKKRHVKKWRQSPKGKQLSRESRERRAQSLRFRGRAYYQRNRDRILANALNWQKANPLKKAAMHGRRAARLRSMPSNFNDQDWQFALNYFGGCCAVCRRPAGLFHTIAMDHFVPLSSPNCPGTVPTNIIPLCHGKEGCNNSKSASHPEQWLIEKFGQKQYRAIMAKIHTFFSLVRKT